MPFWVRLIRFTDEGVKRLRDDLRETVGRTKNVIEENEGKLVAAFATQGTYDIISVIEAPDQTQMDAIDKLLKNQRLYTAKTLTAIPLDTFVEALSADANFGVFLEQWYGKRPGGGGR
jgi:uncharacterized protein with GYD domain